MSSLSGSESLFEKIRNEYRGIPGLRLTRWQFQRLWTLSTDECQVVLRRLVNTNVLKETPDGAFVLREH
jgi:hypothetical protein